MRNLFEKLVSEGEEAINELVAQGYQENVELEFKTKSNASDGELTKEDRKNLGIALSALSNSMGGVLLWGISAAKNGDGVDCASGLRPISEIDKFKSEMERAVSQALMPRHEAIRIAKICQVANPQTGYLTMHIERSERRPHRCEFGEKQYFKRIGDSSVAMEHYDIEDSFKRVVVPALEARYLLSDGGRRSGSDGTTKIVRITVFLKNSSQVSARFPYLVVDPSSNFRTSLAIHRGIQQPAWAFYGGADDVIHPELEMRTLDLECHFAVEHRSGVDYLPRGRLRGQLEISYRCGCLDSRPSAAKFVIPEEEVVNALGLGYV
jgi:Putative DNA-binding domain